MKNKDRLFFCVENLEDAIKLLKKDKITLTILKKIHKHIMNASCLILAVELSMSGFKEPEQGE